MPQVNLSALNGQELRQLLDSSRRRGDAALSYKVLQEMAARRDNPSARRGFSRTAADEPILVDADLGDPAEDDDLPPMPNWRPPGHEPEDLAPPPAPEDAAAPDAPIIAEEVEPAPRARDADRPLTLRDADPEPTGDELPPLRAQTPRRRPAAAAAKPRPAYRPRLRLVVGFALGIAVGTALGFWVGEMPRDTPSPVAAAVAPVQTAALAPAPAPVAEPAAPISAEPALDAQPDAAATPASPANAQQVAGDVNGHASDPPPPPPPMTEPTHSAEIAQPAPERPAAAVAGGCAGASTPADRTICADPNLRRLQGELRRAYNEALEAHQDRALLREHQLAWRDARNAVSDPDRLAQLYEERIRKLNAATAEALRER
jgi:uncharacterized protein YecT (DUF1311 family)